MIAVCSHHFYTYLLCLIFYFPHYYQVYLDTLEIPPNSVVSMAFNIDSTIGKDTKLTLTYPSTITSAQVPLNVTSPTGLVIGDTGVVVDSVTRTITIDIPDIAQVTIIILLTLASNPNFVQPKKMIHKVTLDLLLQNYFIFIYFFSLVSVLLVLIFGIPHSTLMTFDNPIPKV